MLAKSKRVLSMLLLICCIITGYTLWLSLRPVEIIAVHGEGEFNDILVKKFPYTDQGKIKWWLKNRTILKEKYKIPNPASDGFFSMTFWLFGDGYKEEGKYDRLCFDDIKTKEKCIEKDAVFSVSNSKNRGTILTVYDGTYHLKNNGEIVKLKRE